MMLENPKNGRRVLAFLAFMAGSLVGLLFLPPIPRTRIITTSPINEPSLASRISGTSFQICHSLRSE
jgi:hypothetical protein